MMQRLWPLTLLVLLFLPFFLSGCDSERQLAARALHLRVAPEAEPLGFEPGQELLLAPENREALLVMLKGRWPSSQLQLNVTRVIDAEVHVPLRPNEGDAHWITRARVLDSEGSVLWSQRINSLYQLLEFLNIILEDHNINLTPRQVAQLVDAHYPELLEFAIKVPTGIAGGVTYTMEVAQEDGSFQEVFRASIAELAAQAVPTEVEAEVVSLVDNGAAEDRLNVVILADGYRESERRLFETHAQAVADRFMSTTPMAEHADLFNVKYVWMPSLESGAGYDCRPQDTNCEQRMRDTVFETTFVIPAIMDQFGMPFHDVSDRVAMPVQIGKVLEAASLAHYDEIVVISNSRKRSGFAGFYISLVTAFDSGSSFPDVAVHEIGHSLGLLGDEYMVPGDSCYFNEPRVPLPANIAQILDGEVKWSEWLSEDAPIPTPDSMARDIEVGAFEGAYNCDFLVRPSHRCKMNASRDEFCPVCAEQMVRRFYAFVDPAPLRAVSAVRFADGDVRLRVPLRIDSERYEVLWTVDGVPFAEGAALHLRPADLTDVPSNTWVNLEATVRNKSPFIHTRDEAVSNTHRFEIMLEGSR